MPKKKTQLNLDPLNAPELFRFIEEHAQEGFVAGGAIPKGHKKPYTPSRDELIEGVRFALNANAQVLQMRTSALKEVVRKLFQEEK